MPALTSQEHAAVQQETRRRRNEAARARRAAPVVILRAHDPLGGGLLWVATSRSAPGTAYVLRTAPDGRPVCSCPRFAYRNTCAHTEALHALMAPVSERAAGARP